MVQNYDFVVTSGGIGPTHDGSCFNYIIPLFTIPFALPSFPSPTNENNPGTRNHADITYRSLARAFTLGDLAYHKETLRRMEEMSRHRTWAKEQTLEQKQAGEQMAWFPDAGGNGAVEGEGVEVLFIRGDIWVVSTRWLPSDLVLMRLFRGLINTPTTIIARCTPSR
jgi:hypothetical protein